MIHLEPFLDMFAKIGANKCGLSRSSTVAQFSTHASLRFRQTGAPGDQIAYAEVEWLQHRKSG